MPPRSAVGLTRRRQGNWNTAAKTGPSRKVVRKMVRRTTEQTLNTFISSNEATFTAVLVVVVLLL